MLIVLDPSTATPKPPGAPPNSQLPPDQAHNLVSGTVVHAAPLQSLDLEIDHNDPLVLLVISHPTTWSMPMISYIVSLFRFITLTMIGIRR